MTDSRQCALGTVDIYEREAGSDRCRGHKAETWVLPALAGLDCLEPAWYWVSTRWLKLQHAVNYDVSLCLALFVAKGIKP